MSCQPILSKIDSPEDLRKLIESQLTPLAQEVRDVIIDTVSKVGGHLAPCLGVVELTLALHYVFDTPEDKLIWDVGHQAYAHKLITGRRDQFHTLRQYKGISGFPKRTESKYDAFDTGHSSTSISAGLGIAIAKSLQEDPHKTIAVIGDGSMTGGIAFEALNQAGHLDKDLIVILNDNEMSISPNVGAFSSFLSRKLTSKNIVRAKKDLSHFLKHHWSNVGENIRHVLKKSEGSLKSFFTPGMLFEALKFEYIGPISGHNIEDLIETFENVRDFSTGPVLIHVLTKKGKGYAPAERNPGSYHGVGPFNIDTGQPLPSKAKTVSYTKAFGDTIIEIAKNNPKVVGITAAMPAGTGLMDFSHRFPERFFDVGIAEQHAVTFAAGQATEGMCPVVAIYSTFMQRALDQVIHDVCLPKLNVTFAIDRGGVVGDDGPTHHGVYDLTFLRFIPNMILMAPKDEQELQHMLYTAINTPGPTAVRYARGNGTGVGLTKDYQKIAIGKGELLREGKDMLLLPVGERVATALEAAEKLLKVGVDAAVINPRFISPLDGDLICEWAEKTGRIVTIEDNARKGGFGSGVLELLASRGLTIPCRILGIPDRFLEHGDQDTLRRLARIDAPSIITAAIELAGK
jgi:1-deoxy-D-xylulose-5-phosphate synthase